MPVFKLAHVLTFHQAIPSGRTSVWKTHKYGRLPGWVAFIEDLVGVREGGLVSIKLVGTGLPITLEELLRKLSVVIVSDFLSVFNLLKTYSKVCFVTIKEYNSTT